ncbi:hypothetical protein Vqi01_06450 [Micromonospora qiuiae]|uniref:Formate dehydrogenase accessory protein FdhE n=1 Tax=Micromonospora qiuiae TaxID=502268 RepID=A0ABQ4J5M8_9ACTN|nr:hypothetical protein [Micromonospora qiuiae]GIJ25483.1 hypothetical protein Vqi01_06450 [Micromonospora qiuiae]
MTDPAAAMARLAGHPRFAELVDELRAAAPVHQVDQADAAAAHAARLAAAGGGSSSTSTLTALPNWLRRELVEAFGVYARALPGRTCQHAPHPDRPAPVTAATWRPRLVVCVDCAPLLGEPWQVCSWCGAAGVQVATVQAGLLLYLVPVCRGCRPQVVADAA